MNAVEIADRLHREAEEIIYERGLDEFLCAYGRVLYTGSYALNLMVWPDIDIHMILEPDPFSLDAFFKMGKAIAKIEGVISLKFNNFFRRQVEELPEGFYWGVRLDTGTRQPPWKLDIWATAAEILAENETWTTEYGRRSLKRHASSSLKSSIPC